MAKPRQVKLAVNGFLYGGWKTATVTRSMEAIAGTFSLGVSERWANQNQSWPIVEEDNCAVKLGDETVLTGWVDSREPSYDASNHAIEVAGRDRTGELVDCSAYLDLNAAKPTWEFANVDLLKFAQKICKPFGVSVSVQSGLKLPPPPAKLSIDPGDTAFNVLEHACRLFGVLLVADGLGGVVITRSGTERCATALIEGQNILSARAKFDRAARFHRYIVLGQRRATDEDWGEPAANVSAEVADIEVSRTERVLVIRAEGNVTKALAQKRAEWEAITRAARSDVVTVTVQGWEQSDGSLWPINKLVSMKSPQVRIDGEMLFTAVTYSLSVDGGTTTQMTLKRPNAYLPEPVVTPPNYHWKEIEKGV